MHCQHTHVGRATAATRVCRSDRPLNASPQARSLGHDSVCRSCMRGGDGLPPMCVARLPILQGWHLCVRPPTYDCWCVTVCALACVRTSICAALPTGPPPPVVRGVHMACLAQHWRSIGALQRSMHSHSEQQRCVPRGWLVQRYSSFSIVIWSASTRHSLICITMQPARRASSPITVSPTPALSTETELPRTR
jgi:hypothetical protein